MVENYIPVIQEQLRAALLRDPQVARHAHAKLLIPYFEPLPTMIGARLTTAVTPSVLVEIKFRFTSELLQKLLGDTLKSLQVAHDDGLKALEALTRIGLFEVVLASSRTATLTAIQSVLSDTADARQAAELYRRMGLSAPTTERAIKGNLTYEELLLLEPWIFLFSP